MFIYRFKRVLCKPEGDDGSMNGGPDSGNPAGSPAPSPTPAPAPAPATGMEKVTINGEEFEMPASMAKAINGLMTNMQSEMETLKATRTPAPAPAPASADYDFATGLFTEPDVALKKLEDKIKSEIRAEYQQEQATTAFWKTFYETNKDLVGMEILVDSVMSKNYASMKDMPALKAMEKIAQLTKEQATKLGIGKAKKDDDDGKGNNRTMIEGVSHPAANNSTQNTENNVTSLSSIVKDRQERKRKAAN